MAFGDDYYTTTVEVPGFRDGATGALSSDWTLATDTQSPRDIAVKLDNVNICWQPVGAVVPPTAWWKTRVENFRCYSSLRASTTAGSHANIFSSPLGNSVGAPAGAGLIYWLDVAVGTTNNIGTIAAGTKFFSYTVTANLWYRVMMEKAGTQIRFWFNPTGDADPRNLTDSGLVLLREQNLTGATYPETTIVQMGMHASANVVIGATNYCGICDLLLQTLTERTVETGSTPGGPQLVSPSGANRSYRHYKAVRQAVETFNNLKLGP